MVKTLTCSPSKSFTPITSFDAYVWHTDELQDPMVKILLNQLFKAGFTFNPQKHVCAKNGNHWPSLKKKGVSKCNDSPDSLKSYLQSLWRLYKSSSKTDSLKCHLTHLPEEIKKVELLITRFDPNEVLKNLEKLFEKQA